MQAETSNMQPESAEHILQVNSLYKAFGRKQVVRGVDFSMHTGEVVGLLGPNGACNSTTLYMIVGFYRPTSGEVFLDGIRITRLPMYRRARMGISYLPQEASVFRKLTVEQNILAVLESRRDLSFSERNRKGWVFNSTEGEGGGFKVQTLIKRMIVIIFNFAAGLPR